MAHPKYYDSYRLRRGYTCPCGHAFRVDREVSMADFLGLRRAEDDGSHRGYFRPEMALWLYLARYEDGLLVEDSVDGLRFLPPGSRPPDFESLSAPCPACGKTLPPERCPDCGGPVHLERRDVNTGAESDFEWEEASHDLVCPAGHTRFILRQQDYHKGC